MKHRTADLSGARFGSLVVLERAGTASDGRRVWRCRCDCGVERKATTKALRVEGVTACTMCAPESAWSPLAARLRKFQVAENGCWIWTGRTNLNGYGRIVVDGRETRAHRAQFFRLNPDADRTLVVRHSCDNPPCINPDHLTLGTVRENVADMHARGRFNGGAKPGNKNAVGNEGWRRGGIVKILGRIPTMKEPT